ncbi:MAG: STAS domain-containing protein [bacterium]
MGNVTNFAVETSVASAEAAIVVVIGEMDAFTTPQVKAAMLQMLDDGHRFLIVNLQRAVYLDSTALGALVGGLKRAREKGGDLRLVAPTPRIMRLLEITRLSKVFSIDATDEDAVAHLLQERIGAE